MPGTKQNRWALEPGRRRPLLAEVDVAVAGSGISGTFAALAAARCGAKTLIIERMPSLGGNIGPGMILGGTLEGEAETTLPGGLRGLGREFLDAVYAQRASAPRPFAGLGANRTWGEGTYAEDAAICSCVSQQMLRAAGAEILLSACASDPLLRNGRVAGLFVETGGGRWAVKAKAVVDATGEASLARRAGAPIRDFLAIEPGEGVDPRYRTEASPQGRIRDPYMNRAYPEHYNDTMVLCLMANVNREAFEKFLARRIRLSAQDRALANRHFRHIHKAFWPGLCRAWREGNLPIWGEAADGVPVSCGIASLQDFGAGLTAFRITAKGKINPANPVLHSKLQEDMRARAFECAAFLRRHVGGFERAYLVGTQPFFGVRGGPHIAGEHTLTIEEMFAETRFDDVQYRNIHESNHGGPASGFDVPLRCLLPRKLDGMLVCGRGAAYERRGHDPSGMRARPSMMVMGQCAGTTAAIAAMEGTTPKRADIRKIQRRLLKDGIVLGEPERLRELGLAGRTA